MSNDYPTRIDLCDGKYTLIYDFQTGQSECLRYGEPWRQLVGDKMVLACFDTIVELQQQRDEREKDAERYRLLRRGQHWSVIDGIGNTLRADELDAAIDAALAKVCADYRAGS